MNDTGEKSLPVPFPPARVSVSAKATFLRSLPPPPFFSHLKCEKFVNFKRITAKKSKPKDYKNILLF
jgi:hypothetical protein